MAEIQVNKKLNNNYGGNVIVSNPVAVDNNQDPFNFTRAEKIKLENIVDSGSIALVNINEIPSGSIDGNNKHFELSKVPNSIDSVRVFVNGLDRAIVGIDYKTIELGFIPSIGSIISVNYFTQATIIDPVYSQLNLNRLTEFYNAFMLTYDTLTDDQLNVITDNEGKLITIN